jgi:hypothetical protein
MKLLNKMKWHAIPGRHRYKNKSYLLRWLQAQKQVERQMAADERA